MIEGNANELMMRPVVHALSTIAQAAGRGVLANDQHENWCGRSDYDVAIFSYARDFESLWGLKDGMGGLNGIVNGLAAPRQNQDELTILIVWDGMPDSDGETVAVGHYVTPYDWAMALSITLYRHDWQQDVSPPQVQILILDLASNTVSDAFLQHSFFAFHNVVPWIQDYRPVAGGKGELAEVVVNEVVDQAENEAKKCETIAWLRQTIHPDRRDLQRLIDDVLQPGCVMTTFADDFDRKSDLEAVVDSWQQQFLRAGDHHAIANLTAPFILSAGLPDSVRPDIQAQIERGALSRRALRQLLKVVGLLHIDEEGGKPSNTLPLLSQKGGVFGRRKKVRFLLVDDQYHQGYHHVLASTLFGTNYRSTNVNIKQESWCSSTSNLGSLSCLKTANPILDKLINNGAVEDWDLPRNLEEVVDCDVLLLDLRLWITAGQKQQFMEELVAACDALGAKTLIKRDDHFRKAYEKGVKLKDNDKDDEQKKPSEIHALALFPLLLSYYDPSFPIILFSSTHQRDVIEMVSHRKNIIVDFAKPIMSGYGHEHTPSKLIKNLYRALQRAVEMHENRIVWNRLPNFEVSMASPVNISTKIYTLKRQRTLQENNDWRRALTRVYEHYFVRKQYYDFTSVPWEFIEGSYNMGSAPGKKDEYKCRGNLASGLQWIRHRKTHGRMLRDALSGTDWGKPDLRTCAVLEFLVLLDFLSREQPSDNNYISAWENFSNCLKNKYKKGLGGNKKNLPAHDLIDNSSIKNGEFICLALSHAFYYDGEYLSSETDTVFGGVLDELLSKKMESRY